MVEKSKVFEKLKIPGLRKLDSKGRVFIPTKEARVFISKNDLETELPESLVIVPSETGNNLFGMTKEMFESWVRKLREENRSFLDLVYAFKVSENFFCGGVDSHGKNFKVTECSDPKEINKFRLGPLTATCNLGLIQAPNKNKKKVIEALKIVCSVHEEYENSGYFLRFSPVSASERGAVFIDLRERIKNVYPHFKFD